MYLHLGDNVLVKKDKIIAMIDLDMTKISQINFDFLNNLKDKQNLRYICKLGKEKTLIITVDGFFFSPILSTTLLKRTFSLKVEN